MNNNRLFDEHIKEQFSDYAPDVPPHIWENIVAGRGKKRPAGLWFTLLNSRNIAIIIAVLLAGGAGTWWLLKGGNNSTTEKDIALQQTQQATQSNTGQNNSSNNSTPVTDNNNSGSVNGSNNATTNSTSGGQTISADQSNVTSNKGNADAGSIKTTASSSLPLIDNSGKTDNKGVLRTNKIRRVAEIPGKNNITTVSPALETDDPNNGQGTLMGRLMAGIESFAISKQTGEQKLRLTPFSYLPGCPTFEKDAAGNKKYISIYGGPDFAFRSLTDTGNSAYLQKRKESSKVSSAYSAGINYTRVFNNSMSLRAGLNYSQINEKFSFLQGRLVQVIYIIDANGDTTGSYTTSGTRYKTTHNKYRSIDVPLTIGYEMGNGRLHANINAGVVVNVYSWQKGEVLDTSYQPVNITTGKGNSAYQFKTNAGLGVTGGVAVYYKLNDNVHLMAEPYFRYNLKQMNKDNLTLKQKYNTVGLRVGLRVDLQ